MADIRRYKKVIAIALGIHVAILLIMFAPALFRFELPFPIQAIAVLVSFPTGIACGWIAKDLDLKSSEMVDFIITYVVALFIITSFAFFTANFIGEAVAGKFEIDVKKAIKLITDALWGITKPEMISEILTFIIPFYGYWYYLKMEEARTSQY